MKKRLLILPILAGFALSSCSFEDLMFWKKKTEQETEQKEDEKVVTSVKINGSKSTMTVGEELKLTATVTASEGLSTAVDWSSSNSAVATVTAGGKVTAKAEGTVTITAKSQADSTKSDSVTITVKSNGLHPELLDEGFTFTEEFPSAVAKDFVGIDVPSFATKEGFYYQMYASETVVDDDGEETTYPAELNIRFEYTEENYNAVLAALKDFYAFYDPFYEVYSFMNAEQTIQFDLDYDYVSEDSYDYIFSLTLYKTADIYEGSSTDTKDTDWNEGVAELLADYDVDLPFVKLGEDYLADDSTGTIYIVDFCSDYKKLDSYEAILAKTYDKVGSEEEGYYYVKGINKYTNACVDFYFSGYGNTIEISFELRKFEGYPGDEVANYVDYLGSINEIPEFTQEPTALYTYSEDEDGAQVGIYGVSEEQCLSFINSLVIAGFDLDQTQSYEHVDGLSVAYLQNGKIKVTAGIVYGTRDANEDEIAELLAITDEDLENMSFAEMLEYAMKLSEYEETGTFQVTDYTKVSYAMLIITGDPDAHELPGLYLDVTSKEIYEGKTYQLEVEAYKLGEEVEISYASSDDAVATVDETGLVTGIAEGEAVITASATYNEVEYKVEFTAKVVEFKSFVETVDLTAQGLKNGDSVDGKTYATEHGAEVTFSKGSGSNEPKYYDTGAAVRCYGGNTITVSAPEGFVITSIKLSFGSGDGTNAISANKGSVSDGGVWSGSASSVQLSIGGTSGHRRIASLEITFETGEGEESDITATQIMIDIGTSAWGYVEDGDFNDPDEDGVVTSNYSISMGSISNPTDSADCLNGALTSLISDEDFPEYLTVVQEPTYHAGGMQDGSGVSDVYLQTEDGELTAYMYAYYDAEDNAVSVVFEAGPTSAYLAD